MSTVLRVMRFHLCVGSKPLMAVCLLAALTAAGSCISLWLTILHDVPTPFATTLGDAFLWLLKGLPEPEPRPSSLAALQPLRMPFGWLFMVLLPMCVVPCISASDAIGAGALVASGNRMRMWAGMCAAVALVTVVYWAIVTLMCLGTSVYLGWDLSLVASDELVRMTDLVRESLATGPYDVLPVLVGTFVASLALAEAQLALGLCLGARGAWVATTISLGASVFFDVPWLLGNLMSMARNAVFVVPNAVHVDYGSLSPGIGLAESLGVSGLVLVVSLVGGGVMLAHHDVLRGR